MLGWQQNVFCNKISVSQSSKKIFGGRCRAISPFFELTSTESNLRQIESVVLIYSNDNPPWIISYFIVPIYNIGYPKLTVTTLLWV